MILKTKVGTFAVHFRHIDDPLLMVKKITQASIHPVPCASKDRPCLTPSDDGRAYCAKTDNFDKEIGRKIALARAMEKYSRETRAHIWKAYHDR